MISFTKEEKYRDLDTERYELLLSRGEVAEAGRSRTREYVLPLIEKRLREIENERNRLGLLPSDPAKYADAVRDGEEEMTEITAQLKRDEADRI
jgi:hypothetical protein